jgi:biopolymer transport protein ExbD
MQLSRSKPPQRLISLVSMIDVLLIMLVFFMVTSTYLNLDMIPMAQSADDTVAVAPANSAISAPMMIRLGPDGAPYLRGQIIAPQTLAAQVKAHVAQDRAASILILPSPRANTQSLVTLMDGLTRAGASNLRILQLAVNE